jgi:hypothetical protein
VGFNPTPGAEVTPVPDNATLCGLPAASLATETAPGRLPATLGENVTLMVQFAPAATLAPQLFVCE